MPRYAQHCQNLPPYPLTDVPGIKRDLLARGVDVIDLGTGDADLAPPPAAVEALREAVLDPANSRYAFQLGLVEFREEIARWMKGRFGVAVDPMREVLENRVQIIAPLVFGNLAEAHCRSSFFTRRP